MYYLSRVTLAKSTLTDIPKTDTLSVSSTPRSLNVWYSFLRRSSWLNTSDLGNMMDQRESVMVYLAGRAEGMLNSAHRPVVSKEALTSPGEKGVLTEPKASLPPAPRRRQVYLPEPSGVSFLPSPPHRAPSLSPNLGCKPWPRATPEYHEVQGEPSASHCELGTRTETRTSRKFWQVGVATAHAILAGGHLKTEV